MKTLFKKIEVITVPYMEFIDYIGVIGPIEGVNVRPGKVHTITTGEYPHKIVQCVDVVFWGSRKNVNVAKAKLLEYEYGRCNRFA